MLEKEKENNAFKLTIAKLEKNIEGMGYAIYMYNYRREIKS